MIKIAVALKIMLCYSGFIFRFIDMFPLPLLSDKAGPYVGFQRCLINSLRLGLFLFPAAYCICGTILYRD